MMSTNIASQYPEVVKQLQADWAAWYKETL